MGRVKEYFMRQQEEGWRSVGNKYVCADCISDYAIRGFVESAARHHTCSYCERVSDDEIAAPMDDVLAFIAAGFRREYDIPENCLPWDGQEGGWQGVTPDDGYDVVSDLEIINWDSDGADAQHTDLVSAFSDRQFVQHDPFGLTVSEGLRYSWERFCNTVKHQTRFVLFRIKLKRRSRSYDPDEEGTVPVHLVLERIGGLVEEHSLARDLPRRSVLIRARQHKASLTLTKASDLGSPPHERASQSRMSPAGISMFYAAADEKTAFLETHNPRDTRSRCMTFGRFLAARKLRIVDLTEIPDVPSIFDEDRFYTRQGIIFLRQFAADISKPIERDGREHYEYVPTQVVAEYFRSVLKIDGKSIDGIAFRSSRRGAGISYCIFANQSGCFDDFRSPTPPQFRFERKRRCLVLDSVTRSSVAHYVSAYATPVAVPTV